VAGYALLALSTDGRFTSATLCLEIGETVVNGIRAEIFPKGAAPADELF